MIVKKKTLEAIKDIIEKHHNYILVGLGLTPGGKSLIEQIYDHNFKYEHGKEEPVRDRVPEHYLVRQSKEHLNEKMEELLESQKQLVINKVLNAIREENNKYKLDMQSNIKDVSSDLTMEQISGALRDASDDANRNWDRIVNTEMSNAISLGSVDRIVEDPSKKDLTSDERYVYRIVVEDAALCKYCRRFYLDRDGSPKVYKLSTLLANGSNYGKKASAWKPTATATHPNERCSQVLELDQGWKVLPGGSVTYIGLEKWAEYIKKKAQS